MTRGLMWRRRSWSRGSGTLTIMTLTDPEGEMSRSHAAGRLRTPGCVSIFRIRPARQIITARPVYARTMWFRCVPTNLVALRVSTTSWACATIRSQS